MTSITEEDLVATLERAIPEIAYEHENDITTWAPHEWVPWDDGKNFAFLGGEDFTPDNAFTDPEVTAGLLALLLTKDNLPSYHRLLALHFPQFSDWRVMMGVWTAEDTRHAVALRDFLVVRRRLDPQEVEDRRLVHVTAGYKQREGLKSEYGPLDILALLAVHELQCVRFIERLSTVVPDAELRTILGKIRDDDASQARNFLAYLNAGLTADPNAAVTAVDRALAEIEPIGADVADFDAHRLALAAYGSAEVTGSIAAAFRQALALDSVAGLSADGDAARTRIVGLSA